MLTLNKIEISATASALQEVYSSIYSASVEAELENMHRYSSDKNSFASLLLDSNASLDFEWAFIESCAIEGSILKIVAYSFNGNLSGWASRISEKYKDLEMVHSIDIVKSVKFPSYGSESITNEDDVSDPSPKK